MIVADESFGLYMILEVMIECVDVDGDRMRTSIRPLLVPVVVADDNEVVVAITRTLAASLIGERRTDAQRRCRDADNCYQTQDSLVHTLPSSIGTPLPTAAILMVVERLR